MTADDEIPGADDFAPTPRRLIGGGLLAAAAVMLMAIVSFDAGDPSLNHAVERDVANALGLIGAALADLMMQGFGVTMLAGPALLGVIGFRLLRGRAALNGVGPEVAAILCAAAALAWPDPPARWPLDAGLGGVIGWGLLNAASGLLRPLFGGFGDAVAAFGFAALVVWGALRAAGPRGGRSLRRFWSAAAPILRRGAGWIEPVARKAFLRIETALAAIGGGVIARSARLMGRMRRKTRAPRPAARLRRIEPYFDGLTRQAPRPQAAAPDNEDDIDFAADPFAALRGAPQRAPAQPDPPPAPEPDPQPQVDWDAFDRNTPIASFVDGAPEPPRPRVDDAPAAPFDSSARGDDAPTDPWDADDDGDAAFGVGEDDALGPAQATAQRPAQPVWTAPPLVDVRPELDLLAADPLNIGPLLDDAALDARAAELQRVLQDFGVKGRIERVRPGPVVTLFELEPAPGVKSSRIISLADDIARSMSAVSARIAVVPGRNAIGIELPNPKREIVRLRALLEEPAFTGEDMALPLALGRDIGGRPSFADLARMPHLLVAGTTGSGKSVAVNAMILSLLYRHGPDRCRFIMVDPKMLELSVYNDIPHLLTPVVTDPGKAVVALKWAVREMEDRYAKMSALGVRNVASFNRRLADAAAVGETPTRQVRTGFDVEGGRPIYEDQPLPTAPLPFIVVVIDEMADLMLVAGKDVEAAIQRLAQMARAAGIHLIMATQRPSVDVVTGTIKANFPTRISFQVTSKIDSRTILGEQGAEQLLGQGDMLYMAGGGRISRVHGPFVSDREVEQVVATLKAAGAPAYVQGLTDDAGADGPAMDDAAADDPVYDQAVSLVRRERKASTSFVQRHLQIGYNRAARIIEMMEAQGLVGQANHVGKREVLIACGPDDAAA